MGIYKEMEQKGWLNNSDTYRAKDSGVYGRMYQLINQYNPVTGQFGLANTPEARNALPARSGNEKYRLVQYLIFQQRYTKPFGQHHFRN